MKTKKGFTLVEATIAIALLGILAIGIGMPIMSGIIQNGERKVVIARAEALWAGQQSYLKRIANANTNWSGAGSSETRFLLIRDFTPGASDLTLADWQKFDYTYSFGGSLNTRPTITDPDGNTVSY